MPVQEPCKADGRKLRCTSREEGSATCSGIRHKVFALQTVLSKTRRGSLPSANTTFSLPIAVRFGQCCCASARLPGNLETRPCSSSVSRSGAMVAGFLPPVSSCRCSAADGCRHCMLGGMEVKIPVGTPLCRVRCKLASGSFMAAARAPTSSRRKGWPSRITRG